MEEKMDMGMKRKEMYGPIGKEDENKIVYPSFTIEKSMGMKMGQKVMMEGEVTGLKDGKNGSSTTIDIKKCKSMGGKLSDKSVPEIMEMSRNKK